MNLLQRLFGRPMATGGDSSGMYYYVKGHKCGAITRVRIDKRSELSRDDDDTFIVRKGVVDSVCYGVVELELKFDQNYREISRTITGGAFVTKDEYDAWLASRDLQPQN